ncbi:MAG: hypothetical protein KC656_29980, partial [Myxococcales bacterium]|nr:hypothetical protein [Myxococcales bacterium]
EACRAAGVAVRADLLEILVEAGLASGTQERWTLDRDVLGALLGGVVGAGDGSAFVYALRALQEPGRVTIRDAVRIRAFCERWARYAPLTHEAMLLLARSRIQLGQAEEANRLLTDLARSPAVPIGLRTLAVTRLRTPPAERRRVVELVARDTETEEQRARIELARAIVLCAESRENDALDVLETALRTYRGLPPTLVLQMRLVHCQVACARSADPAHVEAAERLVLEVVPLGELDIELLGRHVHACALGWNGRKEEAVHAFITAARVSRRVGHITRCSEELQQAARCSLDLGDASALPLLLASLHVHQGADVSTRTTCAYLALHHLRAGHRELADRWYRLTSDEPGERAWAWYLLEAAVLQRISLPPGFQVPGRPCFAASEAWRAQLRLVEARAQEGHDVEEGLRALQVPAGQAEAVRAALYERLTGRPTGAADAIRAIEPRRRLWETRRELELLGVRSEPGELEVDLEGFHVPDELTVLRGLEATMDGA